MIPRLIIFVGAPVGNFFWNKLFMIGSDPTKPIEGLAATLVRLSYKFHVNCMSLACGVFQTARTMTPADVNNYTEYLGSLDE